MSLHLQELLASMACEKRIIRRAGNQSAKRFE